MSISQKLDGVAQLIADPSRCRSTKKIHPFSKMTVNFEPMMLLWCPLGFQKVFITMTKSFLGLEELSQTAWAWRRGAFHSMYFNPCTWNCAFHFMHFPLCISLYDFHSMHFTLCLLLYVFHSLLLTLRFLLYALTHCLSFYVFHFMNFTLCVSLHAFHFRHFTLFISI